MSENVMKRGEMFTCCEHVLTLMKQPPGYSVVLHFCRVEGASGSFDGERFSFPLLWLLSCQGCYVAAECDVKKITVSKKPEPWDGDDITVSTS